MARLEQNLQAQQRFIGDAAHQMRTPLTGLKMQTELALTETDPENMRILLRQIAESTDRAAHLISLYYYKFKQSRPWEKYLEHKNPTMHSFFCKKLFQIQK